MSIRCFIAVELEEAIQRELGRLQQRLRRKLSPNAKVRWVKTDRIHLTLKFLGEVDDAVINQVCSAASEAAAQVEPFDFEIGNCGCYGSPASARVLWVGVTAGQESLDKLHRAVDKQLALAGFPPERRRFSAHLTLGRIKDSKTGRSVRALIDQLEPVTIGAQGVTELTVFQSELIPEGPVYTALHHGALKS